jgi:flagellin
MSDISLTASMRSNLLALQSTVNLMGRTQDRLASGKKVNSALDNPTNYFTAQAHNKRANDLLSFKDGISESIQTIKAADNAITAITKLIDSAKAVAESAKGVLTNATELAAKQAQYNTLISQIGDLQEDAFYKGKNLLTNNDNMTVRFGNGNTLVVTAFNGTTTGLNINASAVWTASTTTDGEIQTFITNLESALTTLSVESSKLSSNLAIVDARSEWITNIANTLQTGADKLTLADSNEEGANMLMLQTRQSLSTSALSMSAQAAQSVLKLFQ